MAISDFYASTILEVRVDLGFSAFECDPAEITRALGFEPDELCRKGDVKVLRSGRTLLQPVNCWVISSRSKSKDVNEHFREVFERLEGVVAPFPSRFGEPTFSVLWKGNYLYAGSGPSFEPDVIAGVARLRASLYQDIYQIDQDSDVPPPSPLIHLPRPANLHPSHDPTKHPRH